jgi:hypothetical protein
MKDGVKHREHERETLESSRAPFIQRAGFLTLGVFFLLVGVSALSMGLEEHNWIINVFSIGPFLAGLRMFQIVFEKRKTKVSS